MISRNNATIKLRKINFGQSLAYPFFQVCEQFPTAVFVASIINGMYMVPALILAAIIEHFVFQSNIEWTTLMALTCIPFFLCWIGYGWHLLRTLRENGYNATISTSEEISGLFLLALPKVWPLSKVWRSLFVYLFDGLKLVMGSMFFIFIPAGLIYTVCIFTITYVTGWRAESNLILFLIAILLCVLFMPFYFGAIIQSADKRRLSELFNIQRALAAGRECYGKSLIALLSAIIVFSLYTGVLLLLSWWFKWECLLFFFTIPAFAAALITSIHLVTQAFDAYPEDDLGIKQMPIGSDQTPHWIWLGCSNLVTLLWFLVIVLLTPLLYRESGWLGELPTFLSHCDLPLPLSLLALLVGSCVCLLALSIIFHRSSYGKYYEAIGSSTRALELNSKDVKAYINRGAAYEALDKPQKAINDYTRAICLDPKAEAAYKNRAKLYFETRQYERAIEDYSIVISFNPKYEPWGAYDYRASAYDLLGLYQQAIDDYNTIISHNPTNSWDRTNSWASESRDAAYAKLQEVNKSYCKTTV